MKIQKLLHSDETSLTEKNYWADNSYYSDLEVTIYGQ